VEEEEQLRVMVQLARNFRPPLRAVLAHGRGVRLAAHYLSLGVRPE
jgi:hypothetical protein